MKRKFQIGDRVRYIGTKEQDIYHGECVGRVGTIQQLHPWVGVKFDGKDGMYSVATIGFTPFLLERVTESGGKKCQRRLKC